MMAAENVSKKMSSARRRCEALLCSVSRALGPHSYHRGQNVHDGDGSACSKKMQTRKVQVATFLHMVSIKEQPLTFSALRL